MGTHAHRTTVADPVPPRDLSAMVGHRYVYTYANGWQYEMYVKNATTIDYRIHTGMVGGRWLRDQEIDLVMLTPGVYKVSWTEPTGTSVAVNLIPGERVPHGTIFFPHWVEEHPERTVLFQNDHLDQMYAYRDAGATYPICVVPEFAKITLDEFVGENNEEAVAVAPGDLPKAGPTGPTERERARVYDSGSEQACSCVSPDETACWAACG